MKKRRIALVGTASSGALAPYGDKSWEIWGVGMRGSYGTRATRWFELHRLDGEPRDWADKWRSVIKTFSHDVEILMFYPEPNLGPKVTPYPHDRIVERFGTYFMTSSFSWMMALAIDELRPKDKKPRDGEIGIWGVDMEYETEYREQRGGFRHFVDLARVLDINVSRMADTGLSYEPVPYPLWQDDPLLNKLAKRNRETKKRLTEYGETLRLTRDMIAQDRAVIAELKGMGADYDHDKRLAQLNKELSALMDTSATLSRDITEDEGRNEEQSWLKDYLTP